MQRSEPPPLPLREPAAPRWVGWASIATVALVLVGAIELTDRGARGVRAPPGVARSQAGVLGSKSIERQMGGAVPGPTPARPAAVDAESQPGQPGPAGSNASAVGATERAIREAQLAVNAHQAALKAAYDAAREKLEVPRFFDLARSADAETIAARRERVRAFAAANDALQEAALFGAFQLSRELRDRGVPDADVREAIDGYRAATNDQLQWVKRVREADADRCRLMLAFLDFAEASRGQWSAADGERRATFGDARLQMRYEEFIRRAQLIESQQAFAQRQIAAPKE